jgi:thioredoxin reductase (NADPH)
MLYRGQTVCVVGLSAEAVDEANFLARIGATVMFLARKEPKGLDGGVMARTGTLLAIQGDKLGVTELVFKSNQTGEKETFPCGGVFILRPSITPDALISGLEVVGGHIVVDDAMRTNQSGVFAAGDCVGKPLQVAKAVGDGQRACFSAVAHLDQATG